MKGQDSKGYVALDDFVVTQPENCPLRPEDATPTTPTPVTTPKPAVDPSCNFDEDMCNWTIEELPWKWERCAIIFN